MNKTKKLHIVYGDYTLGLKGVNTCGEEFSYIFSYGAGGMESLVIDGKEWLYRVPKPTFWRALTDNDRGSRFHLRSGMWLAADMFLGCVNTRVNVDGQEIAQFDAPENNRYTPNEEAEEVLITFTYETITTPTTQVEVSYRVSMDGTILVSVHYHGKQGLPQLPVFGMRFIMPTKADGYTYEGLSGETYPDRMAGGIPGTYEVEGLPVTPYLVPQDCNVHMETKWLKIQRSTTLNNVDKGPHAGEKKSFSLYITAEDKPFAFACIPYTAEELENAAHQEELPPARRTVLTVLGAVRGVGGIDSWGADVEETYHIDAEKDIRYSFIISGTLK
ncbi:MAG: beta-galactosidase small subunit [Lachnospiraceae bacterium]|nr:beta-galactosidase small subunit [Lachnospiraceae bacterium]